jgi:DNA mismatch repair protein MutL
LYQSELIVPIKYEEIKSYEEENSTESTFKVKEEQVDFAFNDDYRASEKGDTKVTKLFPVALLLGTYIVCQNDEGIYLIDQHAAEERINYEKNMVALRAKEISRTSLLVPINIELSKSEYLIIEEYQSLLTSMGFAFEEFGINTIKFTEHPTWLKEGYEEESIRKILDLIVLSKNDFDVVKFNENVAITLACKLSIKANYEITLTEMEKIIENLFKCENPYNCPHGRPTIISFSKYELEKMFKRVM